MPKIIWEGNQQEWGTAHSGLPLHEGAVQIETSDNLFRDSIAYGIPSAVICFLAVFLKAFLNKEPPIAPLYILPSVVIGFVLLLPLHEFMHAFCYPKQAVVWVGLCLKKAAAYAVSFYPITRKRYIIMSLAPALIGIVPLILFIVLPITCKPLLSFCIVFAFYGLILPCPDYMDVIAVLKQTKKENMIQAANDGLYKY